MPAVSVVIPCYNHARFLPAAIDSALRQTRPADEVIVIDDGSTDDTPGAAARFGNRIVYVRQDNAGLAAARNTGIRRARGELIALLDSDDLWLPAFVESMTALAVSRPEAALYYSAWSLVDADGRDLASWGAPRPAPSAEVYQTLLRADFLVPSAVVMRRSAVLDVGLFDDSLRAQEDWDLWLRLSRRWPVAATPATLVRYRLTPGSLSTDVTGMAAATLRVVEKHFGPDYGPPAAWMADKRRAYGGANRFCAIESLRRAGDGAACAIYLRRALEVDPTLAADLDFYFALAVGGQSPGEGGRFDRFDYDAAAATLSLVLNAAFESVASGGPTAAVRRCAQATAAFALGLIAYGCGRSADARRALCAALWYSPSLALHRQFLATLARACAGRRLLRTLRWCRSQRSAAGEGS